MAMRFLFGASLVALAIISVVSRDGRVLASAQREHEHATAADAAAPPQQTPGMMKMHDEMMAEMKAADARLDALVNDMNTATEEKRIAAVTAVVNELVRQQQGMRAHMTEMHQMMEGRGMMMRGR